MAVVDQFIEFLEHEFEANRLLLPSLPTVVQKICEAVNDERHGGYQLGKLIQMDPNLTARVIQIANSPACRARQPLNSCQIAIAHLGLAVPAFKKLRNGQMGPESRLELLHEARDEIESVRRLLSR